ncbi:MAG: DUF5655 domain-containing protein [Saprospiraceae bacterium]
MWTCSKCERVFKITNQSHYCNEATIDTIFAGKPDILVHTFDELLVKVIDWEPNNVGVAKHAIVFTNKKAWLIVKPMSKELDVKFYCDEAIRHPRVKKVKDWGKMFAHHIRVNDPAQIDEEVLQLLRKGFEYGMK